MATSSSSADPLATSESMLADACAGAERAWWRLVRNYSSMIFNWAKYAQLQDADASDVLQEVLFSVHRKLGDFRHTTKARAFRAWLWTITRRKIIDVYRAKGTAVMLSPEVWSLLQGSPPDDEKPAPTPQQAAAHAKLHRQLESIRAEFATHIWQAFWRTAVDGETAPDVAAELGMTANAVRVAKHRVLSRLRAAQKSNLDQ
jgi:RNA polymerase sigma-70 factor, ECF subfamily